MVRKNSIFTAEKQKKKCTCKMKPKRERSIHICRYMLKKKERARNAGDKKLS